MNAIFSKTMQDTETKIEIFVGAANSNMVSSKVFLNVPKTCFSGVDDFLIDNYDLT